MTTAHHNILLKRDRIRYSVGADRTAAIRDLCSLNADTDCWRWVSTRNAGGMPSMRVDGRIMDMPIVSFTACHGPLPEGAVISRTCNMSGCLNPEHYHLSPNQA